MFDFRAEFTGPVAFGHADATCADHAARWTRRLQPASRRQPATVPRIRTRGNSAAGAPEARRRSSSPPTQARRQRGPKSTGRTSKASTTTTP
jgi:hypothetical protein